MYRDELEAATARADALEREVELLRKRNAELESGDRVTIEARENARRLEAALVREREELELRFAEELEHERDRIRRGEVDTTKSVDPALARAHSRGTINLAVGGAFAVMAAVSQDGWYVVLALVLAITGLVMVTGGAEATRASARSRGLAPADGVRTLIAVDDERISR